jgi:hypothetical protein
MTLIAGLVAVLGFVYLLAFGNKSVPELLKRRRRPRTTNTAAERILGPASVRDRVSPPDRKVADDREQHPRPIGPTAPRYEPMPYGIGGDRDDWPERSDIGDQYLSASVDPETGTHFGRCHRCGLWAVRGATCLMCGALTSPDES